MRMIHRARALYETMPAPLRTVVGGVVRHLPVRIRYGSAFISALGEVRKVGLLDAEEIEILQTERLRDFLRSVETAPYCRRILEEAGLKSASIRVADLPSLPTCSKVDVRASFHEFVAQVPASGRKWVTTGGTTGEPFGFWLEKDASAIDWAYTVNAWSRAGYHLDDPRLVLRGVRLGSGVRRKLWHYEPLRRELYVSVFDLDPEHLPEIRNRIAQFQPRFIHGYPSALESLGSSYESSGAAVPQVDGLLLVSENLYPGQRERLERLFGAHASSFYGMSEKVAFAAECEHSDQLHVEPMYGIVELLDGDGRVIAEPGTVGEIVATGLVNRAMGLIRYRTGDFGAWAKGACKCGRHYSRLDRVRGRWTQEFLVGRSGARISMTALNLHGDIPREVHRFQMVQSQPGLARLLIEKTEGCGGGVPRAFVAALESKLSGQVDLVPEVVASIPLTDRGKHRYIVQEMT